MLAAELAEYLHDQGVGVFDETGTTGNIFVMSLPDAPDECIAVYARGGSRSPACLPYDEVSIQVMVRSTQDPRPGFVTAQAVYDLLQGFRGEAFVTGGQYVVGCHAVQAGPVHIGRDENARHEYSLNFEIDIKNENRRA